MVLVSKYLVPKGYVGMTIFPFILLKDYRLKKDRVLMNHERIHLRQQLELLMIPFYVFYVLEFVIRLIHKRNWRLAYSSISFEKEAYSNEKSLDYLKSRPFWSFIKYL
ncbi:hypothetical protein ACU8DI_13860 [Psychroserpens sp. BH13MA-6]